MLRMLNNDELAKYNNSTPVAYDQYYNYSDMVGVIIMLLVVIIEYLILISILEVLFQLIL